MAQVSFVEIFQAGLMLWVGWKFGIPFSDQQRDRQYTDAMGPVWAEAIVAKMYQWRNRHA